MTETERELRALVLLMLLFFGVQLLIEALIAFKLIPDGSMAQSLSMAHDAWLLFFGMVGGVFRGMVPQSLKPDPGAPLPPGSLSAALPDKPDKPDK